MHASLHRALACLALGGCLAAAHAATPSVRVEVQASQPVLVGQQVPIDVTVVAPNFFTSAPPFPPLEVPGAIVTLPDERATLGVETVAGETYATVQRRYLFSAQQAGDFALPPVKIGFTYGGDDGKPQQAELSLPATRLIAQLPAGAAQAGAGTVLPVARLTIRQSFDRATDSLKAGDALVRTIDVFAAQTQAMVIPPPHFEAPRGVRVFVADPMLSDGSQAGTGFVGGHRVDRATYVFEKAGRYTLPAIEVRWFDPVTRKPASAQAPALTVKVEAGADRGESIAPEAAQMGDARPARRPVDWVLAGSIAVLVLLTGAAAWLVRVRGPRWRAARDAHAVSDPQMFRRALEACSRNEARAANAALLAWCARHAKSTPRAWAAQQAVPGLEAQIDGLERHLFGAASSGHPQWQGAGLAAALQAAHRSWQHGARRRQRVHALGPLNPFERNA